MPFDKEKKRRLAEEKRRNEEELEKSRETAEELSEAVKTTVNYNPNVLVENHELVKTGCCKDYCVMM